MKVRELNVSRGRGVVGGVRGIVLCPMTACVAAGARLMGVPDIVIAGAPGMRGCPLMMYSDALFAVKV